MLAFWSFPPDPRQVPVVLGQSWLSQCSFCRWDPERNSYVWGRIRSHPRLTFNLNKTSSALIFSIYIPSRFLNICFTVIKNICSFSTAFYIQLVQQKVPASQYVLLSFGFNYCDERIQVQESQLYGAVAKECLMHPEKKKGIIYYLFHWIDFLWCF